MNVKEKLQLTKIKQSAYTLCGYGQIPVALMSCIDNLCIGEKYLIEKSAYLIQLTELYLRVRGYWDKHEGEHRAVNERIHKQYSAYVLGLKG